MLTGSSLSEFHTRVSHPTGQRILKLF